MNYEYAAPLIAAEMDMKANLYEWIAGINIRNDPAMLTWAFNTSTDRVILSAGGAAAQVQAGATNVVLAPYQNKELGGMGMAWWTQENLAKFGDFRPLAPLPKSAVPYTLTPRPSLPDEGFVFP